LMIVARRHSRKNAAENFNEGLPCFDRLHHPKMAKPRSFRQRPVVRPDADACCGLSNRLEIHPSLDLLIANSQNHWRLAGIRVFTRMLPADDCEDICGIYIAPTDQCVIIDRRATSSRQSLLTYPTVHFSKSRCRTKKQGRSAPSQMTTQPSHDPRGHVTSEGMIRLRPVSSRDRRRICPVSQPFPGQPPPGTD